jgi:transposase
MEMREVMAPDQRQAQQTAKREIVRQVESGATVSEARRCCPISLHRTTVYRLLKRVEHEGEHAFGERRHGHPIKLRGEVLTFVLDYCQSHAPAASREVQRLAAERFGITVSVSQLNRVRAAHELSRKALPREKKAANRRRHCIWIECPGWWLTPAGGSHRDRPALPVGTGPAIPRSSPSPASANRLNCSTADRCSGSPTTGCEYGSPQALVAHHPVSGSSWPSSNIRLARLHCRWLGAAHRAEARLWLSVYRSLFVTDRSSGLRRKLHGCPGAVDDRSLASRNRRS